MSLVNTQQPPRLDPTVHFRYVAGATDLWLGRCRRGLQAAAVVCAFLLTLPATRAEQADPREIQAKTDCLAGRYQAGVDLLARLFAETGNATYIYNQGRCYEQNGKCTEAILHFREFLRKAKDLPTEETAEVNGHITDCQAMKAEPDGHLTSQPRLQPKPQEVIIEPAERANPGRPSAGGNGLRIAGIVTGSIGAAALVAGVIFSIETSSVANQVTNLTAQNRYDRSKDDRGKLFDKLQWVGYGAGAALLAGGGVLYYLGYRAGHSPDSSSVSLLPVPLPGGSGAVVQGRF